MSLCGCRGLFANDKEVARRRSGAASRDSDEVIHKKRRQACRRINQWFHNIDSGNGNQLTIESARETSSLTAQQPAPKGKVLKLA